MYIWINFVLGNEISLKSLRVSSIQFLQTVSLWNEAQTSWESKKWSQTSKARDLQQILLINITGYVQRTIWRIAKPKSGARIFFFRTSQGQNDLPRPGLEPRSSDSKPSAPTTGLPNKAVALMCPRYSWPRLLKVAPCTVVRSYGRTSKFFPRDGLLRYCIIMGYALRAPLLIQYQPDKWWE